jgi:hypothetical protein
MRRSVRRQPCRPRGFASSELLIVIAMVAIGLAVALPPMKLAYTRSIAGFAARGEPIGWLQHLQATGMGLLGGVIGAGVLYLAALLLFAGGERVVDLWKGFDEARSDFKRHWKDQV